MWAIDSVIDFAQDFAGEVLTKKDCVYIMKNYVALSDWYKVTTESVL